MNCLDCSRPILLVAQGVCLHCARHGPPSVRLANLRLIVQNKPLAALPLLLDTLGDYDPVIRGLARKGLGALDRATVLQALRSYVPDQDNPQTAKRVDALLRELTTAGNTGAVRQKSPPATSPEQQQIRQTLRDRFGLSDFRQGQQAAVENLIAGRNTLVVMPTGAGKSLVFQLASLHIPGQTLVISPLIALMQDQVDSLTSFGISATFINSTLNASEQKRRLSDFAHGKYELAYVAPERLRSTGFQKHLRRAKISLLAVDEAHCISEWGHDFRPDYRHIAAVMPLLDHPTVVALTATATPEVRNDIINALQLTDADTVVTGFNRPNLSLTVRFTTSRDGKLRHLRDLLTENKGAEDSGAVIIYAGTRRDTEEVAAFLHEVCSLDAAYYHAGLDAAQRQACQADFLRGRLNLIVATNAFGMGIDRADVRRVIHYTMPGTLEAYYQEAGRAGRDGRPAEACLLYSPEDHALQEYFIKTTAVTGRTLQSIYRALPQQPGQTFRTTIDELSGRTGLPPVAVRVGLDQLEEAGAIISDGNDGLTFQLRRESWIEKEIGRTLKAGRQRQRHRQAQFKKMIAYAESETCRRAIILDHFGDDDAPLVENCCDNCRAITHQQSASAAQPARSNNASQLSEQKRIGLAILDAVTHMKRPVGVTRTVQVLWGSKAKAVQQNAYQENPYFGRLYYLDQPKIRDLIHQLIEAGFLKLIGGHLPVLKTTPKAKTALENGVPIPLDHSAINISKLDTGTRSTKTATQSHRESSTREKKSKRGQQDETDALRSWIVASGNAPDPAAIPDLIDALGHRNGTIRRLAASALGKIQAADAVAPLIQLLKAEKMPQVRQYAVKALGKIGDPRAHDTLEQIANSKHEKNYTRKSAQAALKNLSKPRPPGRPARAPVRPQNASTAKKVDEVTQFLATPHVQRLTGPWDAGWALDFHSRFEGAQWTHSVVGELVHALKYHQEHAALEKFRPYVTDLCAGQPELTTVDMVMPVPPSETKKSDIVGGLAQLVADEIAAPLHRGLVKTRQTQPQKVMHTLAQKRSNVAGAFACNRPVAGKSILVVDDLYDSGTTLSEITALLKRQGAGKVYVLTMTRTIHTTR